MDTFSIIFLNPATGKESTFPGISAISKDQAVEKFHAMSNYRNCVVLEVVSERTMK